MVVRSNDAVLVRTVESFSIPLIIALAVAAACAILMARVLTRQAMRPLDDVTAALSRFASGDLTPQLIAADERQELGSLAAAYNGAIEQMERAFAARDRANASMRQFIADAGHQLRTPLTVVQGFIAILRRGGIDSPPEREHIPDTMNDQSRIMGALIDKLILLERWEGVETPATPIDVGTLVADLVSPIADAHPDRRFAVTAENGVLAVIDPTELGYVVSNLADNAVKYGEGQIDVRVQARDSKAVIEVADHGPGIPSTDAARVFDRFLSGHAARRVGIGTWTCHRQARDRARTRNGEAREQPERLALYRRASACLVAGEGEIRTHGTLLTFARFRGGCLQPLHHLSEALGWCLLRKNSCSWAEAALPARRRSPRADGSCGPSARYRRRRRPRPLSDRAHRRRDV